jgi:hypothetical protein
MKVEVDSYVHVGMVGKCWELLFMHRKKSFSIFLSPAGMMSLTKLSVGGNNLYMTSLFPSRESLVSDIPAGDGNIKKLFYSVCGECTNDGEVKGASAL